jgi:hypothetical protein
LNIAQIVGRHAQTMAAVVSTQDQNVVGTFLPGWSAVKPKARRLERRIMETMQTLQEETISEILAETVSRRVSTAYKLPKLNIT